MANQTSDLDGRLNAVSVYGQTDGLDDFPVLKAFQQYIDSEQAKARKRMVMLCVFFGFLIAVVITVFMVMLHAVGERNQALNDRLVDYVMKERDRQSEAQALNRMTAAPAANESVLKAMTESLQTIQQKLTEKPAEPNAPSPAEIARQKKLDEEKASLEELRTKLENEKKKLNEEREKVRQQEVEMHRRRLYPEYYQSQDAKENGAAERPAANTPKKQTQTPSQPTKSRHPTLSQADIDEILAEVGAAYDEDDEGVEQVKAKPEVKASKVASPKVKKGTSAKSTKRSVKDEVERMDTVEDDDAIEYFKDDEYSIPSSEKSETAGWTIPLK